MTTGRDSKRDTSKYIDPEKKEQKAPESPHAQNADIQNPVAQNAHADSQVLSQSSTPEVSPSFIGQSPVLTAFINETKAKPSKEYLKNPASFTSKIDMVMANAARFILPVEKFSDLVVKFKLTNNETHLLNQIHNLQVVLGYYIEGNPIHEYSRVKELYYNLLVEKSKIYKTINSFQEQKTDLTYIQQHSVISKMLFSSFTDPVRIEEISGLIEIEYRKRAELMSKKLPEFGDVFSKIISSTKIDVNLINQFILLFKNLLIFCGGKIIQHGGIVLNDSGNETAHIQTELKKINDLFYGKDVITTLLTNIICNTTKEQRLDLANTIDTLRLYQPFEQPSKNLKIITRAELRNQLYKIGLGIEEDAEYLSTLELDISFFQKNFEKKFAAEIKAITDVESKKDGGLIKEARKSAFVNILKSLSQDEREDLLKKKLRLTLSKENKLPSDLMAGKILVENYLRNKYEEFKNDFLKKQLLQKRWFGLIDEFHKEQNISLALDNYFNKEFTVEVEKDSKNDLSLSPSPAAEDKTKPEAEQKSAQEVKPSFSEFKISKPDEEKTLKPNAGTFGDILVNMLSKNDPDINQKALISVHNILTQLPLSVRYQLNKYHLCQFNYLAIISSLLKKQTQSPKTLQTDLDDFDRIFTEYKRLSGLFLGTLKDAEFLSGTLREEKQKQIEGYKLRLQLKIEQLFDLLNKKSLLNLEQPEIRNIWLAATRNALTSQSTMVSLYDVPLVKSVNGTKLDLRDKLSRNMNDYYYLTRKSGGANNRGVYTGIYGTLYLNEKDEVQLQRVLFKQDTNDKNIIEVVCGHLMNYFIGDSAASVFLGNLTGVPSDSKSMSMNVRDVTGENTYVASIMYDGFNELYKKAYIRYNQAHPDDVKPIPDTRPRIRAPGKGDATKVIDSAFAYYKNKGLAKAALTSLLLSDHDIHAGNLGVDYDAKGVERIVKIDHGGAMLKSDLTDELNPLDSRLGNLFKKEPTGHFAEIPRSVCISQEFADAIDEICGITNNTPFDFWTIRKNIEENLSLVLTKEVVRNYGFKPFNDFANRIGVVLSDQLRRAQSEYVKHRNEESLDFILKPTYEYIANKMMKRLDSLREFGLEIKTSVYAEDKDSTRLKELIRLNPSYFFAKKYRLRGEGQRLGSVYTFRFGPFDSRLVEKINNAISDVQLDLSGRRDLEATMFKNDLQLKLPDRLKCLHDRLVILETLANKNDKQRLKEIIAKFGAVIEKQNRSENSTITENQLLQACDDAYIEVVSNYNNFLRPVDLRPGIDEILLVNEADGLTPQAYFAKLHKIAQGFLEKASPHSDPITPDLLKQDVETKADFPAVKKVTAAGKGQSGSSTIVTPDLSSNKEVKVSPLPHQADSTSDETKVVPKPTSKEDDGIEMLELGKKNPIASAAEDASLVVPKFPSKSKPPSKAVSKPLSKTVSKVDDDGIEMLDLGKKKKSVASTSSSQSSASTQIDEVNYPNPVAKMDIDLEFGTGRKIPTHEAAYQEAFGVTPASDPALAVKLNSIAPAVTIVDENTARLRAKRSWKVTGTQENPHIVDRCKNREYFTEAYEVEKLIKVPHKSFWDNFRPGKVTVPDDHTIDLMYRMLLSHIDARKIKTGEYVNIDINVRIQDPAKNKEALHTALLAAADIKNRFNITIDLNTYLTKPTKRQVADFSEYLDSKHGDLLKDIDRPKLPIPSTHKKQSPKPIHDND